MKFLQFNDIRVNMDRVLKYEPFKDHCIWFKTETSDFSIAFKDSVERNRSLSLIDIYCQTKSAQTKVVKSNVPDDYPPEFG